MVNNLKKKSHPKFNVPNQGAKKRSRVPDRWRKQRGIDNKKRVKKNFAGAEPTIGYRNPEALRGVRSNGKRVMLVSNINELKTLMSNPEVASWDVTLSGSLSKRKRAQMVALARQNNIRVTNPGVEA